VLAKSIPPPHFVPPRSGVAIDLDAHLKALPAKAMGKGIYFADLFKIADGKLSAEELAERAGIPHRRYVAFMDYPYADLLKLTLEVGKVAYPKLPLGDAVRLMGRRAYVTMLSSHAGRVLLMSLDHDVERVFLISPKAYKLVLNFGRFHSERVGERHVRFGFNGYPGFLETYQVGVVEGVFEHFKIRGEVTLALTDIGAGTFDVTWQSKEA
jgi:uncharacterized protein (TIGR02265 family)